MQDDVPHFNCANVKWYLEGLNFVYIVLIQVTKLVGLKQICCSIVQ
jgi:hypothetical protein